MMILVTDAITGHNMLINADLIYKIEERSDLNPPCRQIFYIDPETPTEYVTQGMWELLQMIRGTNNEE